jgi:hypothetical protein
MKNILSKLSIVIIALFVSPLVIHAAGFVPGNDVAQFMNTTYGVLNMAPATGGVSVTQTGLTGNAWGDSTGWISFAGSNHSVSVSCNSTTGIGTLSGFAWGHTAGWVNFGPFSNNAALQTTIDQSGYFDGAAWSQNYGWVEFDPAVCTTMGGPGNDTDPVGVDGDGFTGGCVQTTFTCPVASNSNPPTGSNTLPRCTLQSNTNNLASSGPVTLSWTMTAGSQLTLLNTQYSSAGSVVVNPQATTTYTATVTNQHGSRTCTETVIVSRTPETLGCTSQKALNYNRLATVDNGTCVFLDSVDQTWDLEYVPQLSGPVSSEQCTYFKQHLKRGSRGPEVAKVQYFLNRYMNAGLVVDGKYGKSTFVAVHAFQKRHYDDIIAPWSPPLPARTTGRWYKTTMATANIIVGCPIEEVFIEDRGVIHSFTKTTEKLINTLFGR